MTHASIQGASPSTPSVRRRDLPARAGLWLVSAAVVVAIDAATKRAPHDLVYHHYRPTSLLELLLIVLFLALVALWRSRLLAVAAGLLCGGLIGNGGEVLLHGYATDWILVARHLTNIADIAAALGLLVLYADVLRSWRTRSGRSVISGWTLRLAIGLGIGCGALVDLLTHDLRISLAVVVGIIVLAAVLETLVRRRQRATAPGS